MTDRESTERFKRVAQIFQRALELAEAEREEYLTAVGAESAELRAEVDRLLVAHRSSGGFMDQLDALAAVELLDETQVARPLHDSSAPRFLPGVVLGKRYRVVNPLGRGGMGEVYRADDLKLGQPVALKFLRSEFGEDRPQLDLLLAEARLARTISHPNVCRVYDIGELEGQHFISMELVDGEDLASLQRRIGRLPEDKALQIAQQLCAGLAAAHAEGILHRDLKPANVMLDERGRAKIMDFGIAVLEERVAGADLVGTPAYMAPEQILGQKATVRSDIYSLGLVLYELLTGKRARVLDGSSDQTLASPSTYVEGLDPGVEKTILSCLEEEPSLRPASAYAVAAALPGGDLLAATLMAGETPAPDIVAAAGGKGALNPKVALSACVGSLALLTALLFLNQRSLVDLAPVPHHPEVLVAKAREIVEQLGYSDAPVDEAHLFSTDQGLLNHVEVTASSPDRWNRLAMDRPSPVRFWYRRSPELLIPRTPASHVWFNDPPIQTPGMINVVLASTGELRSLRVVPPAQLEVSGSGEEPDWSVLFELAELDQEMFTRIAREVTPRVYCDVQAAWQGRYRGQSEPEVRLEACAFGGRVVEFRTLHPWNDPRSAQPAPSGDRVGRVAFYVTALTLLMVAAVMVRRNLRLGRGDRRGAARVAAFVVVTTMLGWVLTFHHVSDLFSELVQLFLTLGFALFLGFSLWLFYIALEPPVRRVWPELLISWSRVLAGRFRDPLVGSHILFGSLLGLGAWTMKVLHGLVARAMGYAPAAPVSPVAEQLHSPGWFLGDAVRGLGQDILWPTTMLLFLLVFLCFLLRRRWLATVVFIAGGSLLGFDFSSQNLLLLLAFELLTSGLMALAYVRLGLVGALAAEAMFAVPNNFVITVDSSAWYFGYSLTVMVAVAGLIIYSFWVSLGGQSVFGNAEPGRD